MIYIEYADIDRKLKANMNIGIACGGTGGHIFPGIVTAGVLKERGHNVVLWLSGRNVESVSLEDWKGPVERVKSAGFSSGISFRHPAVLAGLFIAFLRCRSRMKMNRPDVLLGMGSYASVGPVLAARSLGIPVVLHEANAVPGRAISFLSHFASAVGIAFEEARNRLRHPNIVLTGLPVRDVFLAYKGERFFQGEPADKSTTADKSGVFTVLVMGGSQGAHRINEVASSAICALRGRGVNIRVIHLAGMADEGIVRRRYENAGVAHEVFAFLKDMAKAYYSADMAVARAGSATCAEISICRLPSLLIPLPAARRRHQTANAMALKVSGGVDMIEEKDFTIEWLAGHIEECYRNPSKLERMKQALASNSMPDAAERLADLVEDAGKKEKTIDH